MTITNTFPPSSLTLQSQDSFNEFDTVLDLAYSKFQFVPSPITLSSKVVIEFSLPFPYPICLEIVQAQNNGVISERSCSIGYSQPAPGFMTLFPASITFKSIVCLRVRIGGLGMFADKSTSLWKLIGFKFEGANLDQLLPTVIGAWDRTGTQHVGSILLKNENISLSLVDRLPYTTNDLPVQTIELEFLTNNAGLSQYISIKMPPANNLYYDISHSTSVADSSKMTFPGQLLDYIEVVDTFVITEIEAQIGDIYIRLGAQLAYLRDMAWVECLQIRPGTSTKVEAQFSSDGEKWPLISLPQGSTGSITLECRRIFSSTAQSLANIIDVYGSSGAFSMMIYNPDRPTLLAALVPTFQPSLLDSIQTFQNPTRLAVLPRTYSGQSSSWRITTASPGIAMPYPNTMGLGLNADIHRTASGYSESFSRYMSTNTNLVQYTSTQSRIDDFIYYYSESRTEIGTVLNPVQEAQLDMTYTKVPARVNDQYTMLGKSGVASLVTVPPTVVIGLYGRSFLPAWQAQTQLPAPHIPDMYVEWKSNLHPFSFEQTANTIQLISRLKPRPLYYPTNPSLLIPSSVWVTSPNVIIYPGSALKFTWTLSIQSLTISNVQVDQTKFFSKFKVENKKSAGLFTTLLISTSPDPIIIPNDEPDILTAITITFAQTIPSRVKLDYKLSIHSSYELTGLGANIPASSSLQSFEFGSYAIAPIAANIAIQTISQFVIQWNLGEGLNQMWVEANTATAHPTTAPTLSSTTLISFSTPDPTKGELDTSIDLGLWYYPLLDEVNNVYAKEAMFLHSLATISGQTSAITTATLYNGKIRGYSRAILRATYTIPSKKDLVIFKDYQYFFLILPGCWSAQRQSSPQAPPILDQFSVSCPESTPICSQSGKCLSADPVVEPTDPICSRCHPDNTVKCTPEVKAQPCECKNDWTGPTCFQSIQCQTQARSTCKNPATGFVGVGGEGRCETGCSCFDGSGGRGCQTCLLTCFNNGIMSKDCDSCGCSRGYTGNQCQCMTVHNTIILLKAKKNPLLEFSNGWYLPHTANEQIISTRDTSLDDSTLPTDLDNEANIGLFQLGQDVWRAIVEPYLGDKDGVFSLTITASPAPEDPDNFTKTFFNFTTTFGCDGNNKDIKSFADQELKFVQFHEMFVGLDVIKQNFGFDLEQPVLQPPQLEPETLPPPDADDDDDSYELNHSRTLFSPITVVIYSIGIVLFVGMTIF